MNFASSIEWIWMNIISDIQLTNDDESSFFNHNFISNKAKLDFFYIFVMSNNQIFLSQILRVVGPLGESSIFLVPWEF